MSAPTMPPLPRPARRAPASTGFGLRAKTEHTVPTRREPNDASVADSDVRSGNRMTRCKPCVEAIASSLITTNTTQHTAAARMRTDASVLRGSDNPSARPKAASDAARATVR